MSLISRTLRIQKLTSVLGATEVTDKLFNPNIIYNFPDVGYIDNWAPDRYLDHMQPIINYIHENKLEDKLIELLEKRNIKTLWDIFDPTISKELIFNCMYYTIFPDEEITEY